MQFQIDDENERKFTTPKNKKCEKKQKREKRNCKNNGILAQCYKYYKVSCKFHNAINTFEIVSYTFAVKLVLEKTYVSVIRP